ncbi:MAG TPA: DUF393 domain-containing protein, partial [Gammaproteobacteria bacterium]|nr:DUF393 domain-containing protein [Gammaproteobacteria bacterium]
MKQLSEFDAAGRLILEDINAQDFQQRFPHIDPKAADRILHGQYGSG